MAFFHKWFLHAFQHTYSTNVLMLLALILARVRGTQIQCPEATVMLCCSQSKTLEGIAGTLQALYGTSHHWISPPASTLQLKEKDINSKSDKRCCPVEKVTAANEQLVHPAAMTALG